MIQLLLIRHGQSANNALPEHQRVCDPGLTDLGVQQAALTAAALRNVPFSGLYCSPFLRSLETMRPLAEAVQMSVSIRADLFEQGGCYSGHLPGEERGEAGMSRSELIQRYPQWQVDQRIGHSGWWGQPYELLAQATQRAECVVRWLHEQLLPQGGIHALVIHADFKRLLLAALFAENASRIMPSIGPLHNTGVTRLAWAENHWQLQCFNATTHLPFEYVT
ncbi:MAG: histidine phosphatase family protein [Pirellulaceae bacterium]